MEEHFVGREIDPQSAAASADAIVVAEMLSPGQIDLGPPGQAYHFDAKIKILRDLTGNLSGEHTLTFTAQRFPEDIAEKVPDKGEVCIFFLQRMPDNSLHAIKMLLATDESVKRFERSN